MTATMTYSSLVLSVISSMMLFPIASVSSFGCATLNIHIIMRPPPLVCRLRRLGLLPLCSSASSSESSSASLQPPPAPLCDLQTFLKLCQLVQSGGEAKVAIQDGRCYLNGEVERRRSKKLFAGDQVSFGESGQTLDVSDEVYNRGYVYKAKAKKVKPVSKVDAVDGNLEFGGRYRSEEWRAERKKKKAERKARNSNGGQ